MIRGGFLSAKERTALTALARDGLEEHRVARRANALLLLDKSWSCQKVAEALPEVIVLAWAATKNQSKTAQAYKVKAWRDVPAIRNRHVYVLRDEWLNTPGPPLVRGAQELHKLLRYKTRPRPALPLSTKSPSTRKNTSHS